MGLVELWTLYAFAVSFTVLRTYARVSAVGYCNLQIDDYLVWIAILIYTAQCSLRHSLGVYVHGLANDSMTPDQRSTLSRDDPEYSMRVLGSKLKVAGWTTAACLLWSLKLCVALFYLRLINGLHNYTTRIYTAFALIITTFVAVIFTIYLSCRPFHHYWQINPDPGNTCTAAESKKLIWVTFILNVVTDLYLLLIPIPMLWKSSLKMYDKIAAMTVLGAGMLVIVCAIVKSFYLISDTANSAEHTASWGSRETFVAIFTTNLPMIFPLLRKWFGPFLSSTIRSSNVDQKKPPPGSGFRTIGGGFGNGGERGVRVSRTTRHRAHHISTNLTLQNDSEERILNEEDLKLHNI
ncbi:hypothetical protein ACET3X_006377 [Alternaria dauci]|uniref:Rhodopsin domain-containing protein n=1 Tax=Alternaria dauci TaxID=48095 RepID=A0ABR3UDH4_9PLEO